MKHYFLAGLLAFICTGCLGDILDEDGSLYSDTDLLGTWDTTTTWFILGGDEAHFNEMRFCMAGEAEHESFIDGIPDESYAGEFLGIKQG